MLSILHYTFRYDLRRKDWIYHNLHHVIYHLREQISYNTQQLEGQYAALPIKVFGIPM